MFKRLKSSIRGLTFSMTENSVFTIGSHYRYVIDKANKEVIIFPSDKCGNTVSRKCYCGKELPLIDIRSKEVRELVSRANYLDLEILSDSIVVHIALEQTHTIADCKEEDVPVISFIIPNDVALCDREPVLSELLSKQVIFRCNKEIRNDLKRVFSVVSLFSGCGGLDQGFLDSSFKIIFANELNPAAAASYERNIHREVCINDIRTVYLNLPKSDALIAGIPCTPYTQTNRSKVRMERSKDYELIHYYLQGVIQSNPKVFAIENVPAFLSERVGNIERIKEVVPEYKLSAKVVCDSDLGGFSYRRRLILFGSRIGKINIPDIEIFPKRTVKEALDRVNESWGNYYDISIPKEHTKVRMRFVPQGGNYLDMPEELRTKSVHSNIFRRLHPDLPSPSLPNFRKVNILHPTEDRIISVAEASAIQGNNKDFVFLGTLQDKQQQAGNMVTKSISIFIATIIKDALLKYYSNNFSSCC